MQFIAILLQSWKTTFRQYKICLILWAITAVCSLPVLRVAHRFLAAHFGNTTVGTEWLNDFDLTYIIELVQNAPSFVSVLTAVFIVMLVIYYFVSVWTTGGVLGFLDEEFRVKEETGKKRFFRTFSFHGGRLFGRFFLLTLITGPLVILSLIPVAFGLIGVIISALLVLAWAMVSDVTKVIIAGDDTAGFFRSYLSAFRVTIRRFPFLAGLYVAALLALSVVFFLYSMADNAFTPDTVPAIILMILLQQLWIGWRSMVRVQLFSAVILAKNQ